MADISTQAAAGHTVTGTATFRVDTTPVVVVRDGTNTPDSRLTTGFAEMQDAVQDASEATFALNTHAYSDDNFVMYDKSFEKYSSSSRFYLKNGEIRKCHVIFLWLVKMFSCCSKNISFNQRNVLTNLAAHRDARAQDQLRTARQAVDIGNVEFEPLQADSSNIPRNSSSVGDNLEAAMNAISARLEAKAAKGRVSSDAQTKARTDSFDNSVDGSGSGSGSGSDSDCEL